MLDELLRGPGFWDGFLLKWWRSGGCWLRGCVNGAGPDQPAACLIDHRMGKENGVF